MKAFLGVIVLILMFVLPVTLYYVVIPVILAQVLFAFGIKISFWLALGIVVLVYVLFGLLRK